jgi:hypothetical protein
VFADLVNGAEVGMLQCGSRACFPAKAFERLRVLRHIVRQEFQGDKAAKVGVFSFVDHTHPATADLFDIAVVIEMVWPIMERAMLGGI